MNSIDVIKKTFYKLWDTTSHNRARFLFGCVLVISTMAVNLSIPLILKFTIQALDPNTATLSDIAGFSVVLLLILYGAAYILAQTLHILREIVFNKVIEDTIRRYYLTLFQHIMKLDLQFHLTKKTGSLTNTIERFQTAIPEMFRALVLYIIPTSLEVLLAVVIVTGLFGWQFGLALLTILTLFLSFTLSTAKWAGDKQKQYEAQRGIVSAQIVESMMNIETAHYCNNIDYEIEQCNEQLKKAEKKSLGFKTRSLLVHIGQGVIVGCGLCVLTALSGYKVLNGQFHISDFVAINAYLLQFAIPLGHFGWMMRELHQAVIKIGNGLKLLDYQPKVIDKSTAKPLDATSTDIVFKNVSFGYDDNQIVLNNLNFTIPKSSTVAIVGESGSGKSTITKLLFRHYDVNEGAIIINQQDIRDITKSTLHQTIGVIPQDIVLFNASLLDNIRYGNRNANLKDIENVVQKVKLDNLIQKAPNGYDTIVGERGLKLSGGEKQRLALARMLLKEPKIFLFDEATSSLDSKTEKEILNNIIELTKNTTTLIIAHRLSTITHADNILFLDNHNIVESGTHQQLLEADGKYAMLWYKQMNQ